MRRYRLAIALLGSALMFLASCGSNASQSTTTPVAAQPAVVIAEGRLQPVRSMDQSFSVPGQVGEVLVKDGEDVKADQVLARLVDVPEARLALARAHQEELSARQALDELDALADVSLAQARLNVIAAQEQMDTVQAAFDDDESDRNRAALDVATALLQQAEDTLSQLSDGAGVDPGQRAAAEARLTSAGAAVASAQVASEGLELRATMGGTVVDLDLQASQRVLAGESVMALADVSGWVVETYNLTEVDVTALEVGQEVVVTVDALPGVTFQGEITHINARFEERQGDITYTVTISLRRADPLMRWGMTAAVEFGPYYPKEQ